MKRMAMVIAGLILILSTSLYASNGPASPSPQKEPTKTMRETKVSFTGIVKEISDTMITVERSVKGKTETMEFALDKPMEKIKAGDKVRVSYVKKEGKNIATKVTPFTARKIVKKPPTTRETKPSSPEKAPLQK